jgi:hypothetical protein
MNRNRLFRYGLPVLLLTVSLTTLAFARNHPSAPLQSHDASVPASSPAAADQAGTSDSHVTVNGQPVNVGADGTARVSLPSGEATVQSSGDTTTVVTSTGPSATSTVSGNGNLDVSVQSVSNGGANMSATQLHSFSSGTTWSSSSSSTMVSGNGHSSVHITQP